MEFNAFLTIDLFDFSIGHFGRDFEHFVGIVNIVRAAAAQQGIDGAGPKPEGALGLK